MKSNWTYWILFAVMMVLAIVEAMDKHPWICGLYVAVGLLNLVAAIRHPVKWWRWP